jgi:hemolysin III
MVDAAAAPRTGAIDAPTLQVKPRLRGVSHQWAFFVSVGCGAALVATAHRGAAIATATIYAASVSALLGTSALYHRVTWRPQVRRWMRRLDHAMIFFLIGGTYTPIAVLALHGTLATVVLAIVWGGAATGVGLKLGWIDAPKPVTAAVYVALGWVCVATFAQLTASIGVVAVSLLALGGVLYTCGAVIYALGRPNPIPGVFGYHEVFHALVIAAAALHYGVIAFVVLPRG